MNKKAKNVKCNWCSGLGYLCEFSSYLNKMIIYDSCSICNGRGYVTSIVKKGRVNEH